MAGVGPLGSALVNSVLKSMGSNQAFASGFRRIKNGFSKECCGTGLESTPRRMRHVHDPAPHNLTQYSNLGSRFLKNSRRGNSQGKKQSKRAFLVEQLKREAHRFCVHTAYSIHTSTRRLARATMHDDTHSGFFSCVPVPSMPVHSK